MTNYKDLLIVKDSIPASMALAISMMLKQPKIENKVSMNCIPEAKGSVYTGSSSVHGRIKHAGEVRRVKRNKRYRTFQKSLRG